MPKVSLACHVPGETHVPGEPTCSPAPSSWRRALQLSPSLPLLIQDNRSGVRSCVRERPCKVVLARRTPRQGWPLGGVVTDVCCGKTEYISRPVVDGGAIVVVTERTPPARARPRVLSLTSRSPSSRRRGKYGVVFVWCGAYRSAVCVDDWNCSCCRCGDCSAVVIIKYFLFPRLMYFITVIIITSICICN